MNKEDKRREQIRYHLYKMVEDHLKTFSESEFLNEKDKFMDTTALAAGIILVSFNRVKGSMGLSDNQIKELLNDYFDTIYGALFKTKRTA